jgi:hypothetical protein
MNRAQSSLIGVNPATRFAMSGPNHARCSGESLLFAPSAHFCGPSVFFGFASIRVCGRSSASRLKSFPHKNPMNRTKSRLIGVDPVAASRFGPRFVPNLSAGIGTGVEPSRCRCLAWRCELRQLALLFNQAGPCLWLVMPLTAEFQFVTSII